MLDDPPLTVRIRVRELRDGCAIDASGLTKLLPLCFRSSRLYFGREGEAPAEPMRRQLGRSLALP